MHLPRLALIIGLLLISGAAVAADEAPNPMPGIAMHGKPKYGPDFKHLDYVNPDAPKGGEMRLAALGTFDNLNPFVLKGVEAPGIMMTFQTLTAGTGDEALTRYGMIAESIEMPEDRSWVAFNLRKEAKWNDGKPITADDVVWTFDTLMAKGHPQYRSYYTFVKKAEAESPARVKFTFSMAGNRELPLIMGELPVLPKHYWEGKKFDSTTLEFPLGSGPYRVKSIDPGRRVTYERVKDWWAKDLPINKGRYNFDTVVIDEYRDETVLLHALFSGNYDLRRENVAKSWAVEYNQKPVNEGLIQKEEIKNSLPVGMQGFVYNTRRVLFQDPKVRQALGYAFDFEWSNKQVAYGAYKRTHSYFENSELASSGLPSGRELEILEPYRGKVPEEVFTSEFKVPETDGSGNGVRENLGKAKELLNAAGWRLGTSGMLEKDGQPFQFEILSYTETFERWILPFIANLKKLGIAAKFRKVDAAQYQHRVEDFDFDMTLSSFGQSLSPGNEQLNFWGSSKADVKGSHNIIGIKSPVVDDLITKLVSAKDREELIATCHALDRVLLWGYYVIPNWYIDKWRVAYWNKFGRPAIVSKYDLGELDTWWYDKEKADKIAEKVAPDKKK
ncbi:MAG: extracellular solute-binding protein [Alphaproteobacteria bacterium]